MKRAWLPLVLLLCTATAEARQRVSGYCERGGQSTITQGLFSTTKVQVSYPACLVGVYYVGTPAVLVPPAEVYEDITGTPKSGNPFTADTYGYWYFYVDIPVDVHMSGGGIPAPGWFARGDYYVAPTFDVADFPGATGGAKIAACIAALPATGGTCDARGLEGAQTIGTTVVIDKPVNLLLGAATYTATANPAISIASGNLHVSGVPGWATKIISASGGKIFQVAASLSGTWTLTPVNIEEMELQGGGGTSQAVYFPLQSITETHISFHRLLVHGFGNTTGAIQIDESNYFVSIQQCTFHTNVASVYLGRYVGAKVDHNEFYWPQGGPQLTLVGNDWQYVENNTFIYAGNGTGTGPDIKIEPVTTGGTSGSAIYIQANKFGSDVSETSARYKIQLAGSSITYVSGGPVYIVDNYFAGPIDYLMKAIRIENNAGYLDIERNYFIFFATLVSDVNDPTTGGFHRGMNVFRGNSVLPPPASWSVFENGGRGFAVVDAPATADIDSWDRDPLHETVQLQNRATFSEDFNSWNKSGVTVTAGQTDPFGGARARLLDRANAAPSEYINNVFDSTSLGPRFYISFWAKAGSLSSVQIRLYDVTAAKDVEDLRTAALPATWKHYCLVWSGLNAAHAYRLYLYPGSIAQLPGNLYLFGVQIADQPSDYYPTTGAAASTTAYGSRLENGLLISKVFASTLATGTAPFSIVSTTPVANLAATPTTYNAAGTQQTNTHLVWGTCTIGTSCSITLAGAAVFTNNTSYDCFPRDATTPANAVTVTRTSGSALAFTGTGVDVVNYFCVGN